MVTSAWVGIVVPKRQENKERMKINISTSLCFVVVDVSNVTGLKDLSRKKLKFFLCLGIMGASAPSH